MMGMMGGMGMGGWACDERHGVDERHDEHERHDPAWGWAAWAAGRMRGMGGMGRMGSMTDGRHEQMGSWIWISQASMSGMGRHGPHGLAPRATGEASRY